MKILSIVFLSLMNLVGLVNAVIWPIIGIDVITAVKDGKQQAMLNVTADYEVAFLCFYLGFMGVFVWAISIWLFKLLKRSHGIV